MHIIFIGVCYIMNIVLGGFPQREIKWWIIAWWRKEEGAERDK